MTALEHIDRIRKDTKSRWIRLKWERCFAREGDYIIGVTDTVSQAWISIKDKVFELVEIVVDAPDTSEHGILRRIKISWFWDELFHPKKFKLGSCPVDEKNISLNWHYEDKKQV